ncbi:unnamed protein product [Durusdinium trenchii]|uniref:Fe2OG dioxygenase domain-containing protein n=1 Tax=Durusdinium trenchii TaxID=1381693 RepID=A0ABP0HRB8_9DINO
MRRPAAALRKESDSESELEIDTRVWRLRRGADLVQAWKRPPSKIELQELAAAARKLSKGACSYWIPAFAQPTTPVQRFALDVFHFHCRRLGWTPKRLKALGKNAGAEVWAQRRSGKERQERRGMNWHFDKDEDLLDDCELVVHPLIGTATYLSDAGAPLMVFSQPTLQMSEDGPLYHEPRLRRRQSDAFVAFPQKALHVAFSGQLLHGVPGVLEHSRGERLALLVNVWLHHRPIGLERCGAEPTERGGRLPNNSPGRSLCFRPKRGSETVSLPMTSLFSHLRCVQVNRSKHGHNGCQS